MSSQITWKINSLQCNPKLNNNENVVFQTQWECIASDGDTSVSVSGTQTLDTSNITSFVKYENLTEAVVLSWVKNALSNASVLAIEQSASDRLEKQKNPDVVLPALPWAEVAQPE